MSSLFEQHPLRQTLSDEVHARPPVPLDTPEFVTYLAFLHHEGSAGREAAHLAQLAGQLGLPAPSTDSGHVLLEADGFRLKWERHNEFSSYCFFRRIEPEDSPDEYALLHVPAAWRKAIPGQLIAATHIELRSVAEVPLETVLHQQSRHGQALVASSVSDGAGWVLTDFHLHDGFSHFLLLDNGFTPRQAGRIAQRLVEIETYRVMALLAFPVAKDVGRLVSRAEDELADLMDGMGQSRTAEDDRAVLVPACRAWRPRSSARWRAPPSASVPPAPTTAWCASASTTCAKQRLPGFSPIGEFMDRRLVPAIDTCTSIARRQDDLSGRIARNSQLLRTRVDVEIERQNQELLAQMNRRARIQLHLQETVEGLSVVAITYYASQLVNYVAKGAKDFIAPATPEVLTALSIPVIAGLVCCDMGLLGKEEGSGG
jgi:uncharacterized membrane-anchored protein